MFLHKNTGLSFLFKDCFSALFLTRNINIFSDWLKVYHMTGNMGKEWEELDVRVNVIGM